MAIVKDIFRILKNGVWDEHYFKTSADQVVYTKSDGVASNVQKELDAQNSALSGKASTSELSAVKKELTTIDTNLGGLIKTQVFTKKNIKITPLSQTSIAFDSALSGYTRIGVVSYNANNADTDGYGSSYANFYKISISEISIKNTSSENTIVIDAQITVLYRKNV